MNLQAKIEQLKNLNPLPDNALETVEEVIKGLNIGSLRVVNSNNGQYTVNEWVKTAILLYFRLKGIEKMDPGNFFDKIPLKTFESGLNRIVPYSSARYGAYIAPRVIVMAPSFVNIGAYVDSDVLIDSLVLVGSCAQIGARVHIGAGTVIGGVLEPANAKPVIIEDDAFIGGNCGIYEGVQVDKGAVIGAGTIITSKTPIIDINSGQEYFGHVPANAVVVPGGRIKEVKNNKFVLQSPLIIKMRDPQISAKLALEDSLREFVMI